MAISVGPFPDDTVTVSDLDARIDTGLSTSDKETLIDHAGRTVGGLLDDIFIDPTQWSSASDVPNAVWDVILRFAIIYAFDRDASNFGKVSNVREGDAAVGLAGQSNSTRREKHENVMERFERYATAHSPLNKPRVHRAVQASLNRANTGFDAPRGSIGGGDPS